MTTSTLLNSIDGRQAMLIAAQHLLKRRLSRFFKRNLVIDYNYWKTTGQFPLSQILGQLNGLNDQEILDLYHLLGVVGGLPTSIADTTIFVNAVTGSDVTGDGSSTSPFASLWFMDILPRRLNHKYRVVLQSDVTAYSLRLDFDFGEDGSFAILGQGTPQVLETNLIGSIGTLGGGGGMWVACVGGFGVLAQSSFIESGNFAVPVHKIAMVNNALIQGMPWTLGGVTPGDDCHIVRPSRTLTVENIEACCTGGRRLRQSQVGIFNLNIDFPASTPPFFNGVEGMIKWRNTCESTLSFVRFNYTYNGSGANPSGNEFRYGSINTNVHVDRNQIYTLAACGISNLDGPDTNVNPYQPSICGAKFGDISISGPAENTNIRDCEVMAVDFDNVINLRGCAKVTYSNALMFVCRSCNYDVQYCMVDGIQTAGPGLHQRAGIESYCSVGNAERITTLTADNCMTFYGGCICKISQCGSDATYSSIANGGIWAEGQNILEAWYNAAMGNTPITEGMVGATGNLISYTTSIGETADAWPAVDELNYTIGTGATKLFLGK
jgi:hypothetical protein